MKQPIENTIKINSMDMAIGESRSMVCPFCEASHEKSFTTTKTNTGILYHCFRAKCQESGFIPLLAGPSKSVKREQQRHFTRPLKNLSHKQVCWLYEQYGLDLEDIDKNRWKYDYTQNRLYMPILTEEGLEAGATSKVFNKTDKPKTLTYFWSPLYHLHVAPSRLEDGPVVVVEDQISAAKVAKQSRCVALLGTHMSVETAQRLRLLSTQLTIALDADTWDNSRSIGYNMKHKYGLLFENFSVVRLSKDPKSMSDNEIKEIILGNGAQSSRSSTS